ncbi:hypothetical protein HYW21_00115 [Candidatus Woesearchaeota archaeon]|nr:hypothetical protein [Candidatus Woesearchaeota archaeon]
MVLRLPIPKQRAQLTFEFFMLIAFGFLVLILIFIIVGEEVQTLRQQQEFNVGRDLAFSLQTELYLAAEVEPNYFREFYVPDTIKGVHFNVTMTNERLIITTKNFEHVRIVPPVTGLFVLGQYNNLSNRGGTLFLNS